MKTQLIISAVLAVIFFIAIIRTFYKAPYKEQVSSLEFEVVKYIEKKKYPLTFQTVMRYYQDYMNGEFVPLIVEDVIEKVVMGSIEYGERHEL